MRLLRSLVIPALLATTTAVMPGASNAQVVASLNITIAPPPLPVYKQPVIPGPGYLWTPGYWAWGPYGYYWVPGTWVLPPAIGFLWTPGYWAFDDGVYRWHDGYWGPHVGFYGGVNYGFGYTGVGYHGGYWSHDHFRYNVAVNNVRGAHVTNVYTQNVTNVTVNRVSFNGGHGGYLGAADAAGAAGRARVASPAHFGADPAGAHGERQSAVARFSQQRPSPRRGDAAAGRDAAPGKRAGKPSHRRAANAEARPAENAAHPPGAVPARPAVNAAIRLVPCPHVRPRTHRGSSTRPPAPRRLRPPAEHASTGRTPARGRTSAGRARASAASAGTGRPSRPGADARATRGGGAPTRPGATPRAAPNKPRARLHPRARCAGARSAQARRPRRRERQGSSGLRRARPGDLGT